MIEDNFYEVRGTTKRFFNAECIKRFFDSEHWEIICMNECEMEDDRIKSVQLQGKNSPSRKTTWTCMVKKK